MQFHMTNRDNPNRSRLFHPSPPHAMPAGVAFFHAHRRKEHAMRASPFESQLERLARTLTEQFGVQAQKRAQQRMPFT